MVNMRPEQAIFFAIYIAGLSGARPLADLDLGSLESLGVNALSQYQAASSTTAPTETSDSSATATATGSIDVAGIEADVSKVLDAASSYLHVTSLPQIPTFLGLPAPKVSECASKIVAAAEPSITANPILMDAAVAGAMDVAGKYLSTTTQSGSTLIGFAASDLPKVASEIVTLMPAGVKSAASSMISAVPSDAKSIESFVASAIPTQYQTAAQSIYASDIPSSMKTAAASAIQGEVSKLPTGVQSAAQSLETYLPSAVQGDINSLLGMVSATATPSVTSSASVTSATSATYDLSGYASKRGIFDNIKSLITEASKTATTVSTTSTPTPTSTNYDAFSASMQAYDASQSAAIATMSIDCTGIIGC